jgi:hypothetical protein
VKIVLAYLVPMDAWESYAPSAARFAETYMQFPAQIEHDLVVVCTNGPGRAGYSRARAMFKDLATKFEMYQGGGWDTGAAQSIAHKVDADFLVIANTGVYFHRAGWLKRFAEARAENGEGLYGASASYESSPWVPGQINPHIRTSFYGCNPLAFRDYPHIIDSREKSFMFEAGEWNFMRWFEEQRGQPGFMVTWDGCYQKQDFRTPPNVFRKGDQSNNIIFDRYMDVYARADPQQRQNMETMANAGLRLY